MYTKVSNKSMSNTGFDWVNGVEGKDLFNSKFLFDLRYRDIDFKYEVIRYLNRLDLISNEIYGNLVDNYLGVLIIKNHIDPNVIPLRLTLKCYNTDSIKSMGSL